MDIGLKGRVVVVTGGTSGIGLATVRLLLREGAYVALCGRDQARLAQTRDSLAAEFAGDHVLAQRCDVIDKDEVAHFAAAVTQWRGACDALVNNAGGGRVSTFADTDDAAWRQELELKFFGQILPIRAFKPLLEKSDIAAIVTVSSLLAYQPEPHMVCTSAARAGVQNLLKSLAREFAPHIRAISAVRLIDLNQWQRRFEAREDKSQTREAWYAAPLESTSRSAPRHAGRGGPRHRVSGSPAASYITGAQLEISGGISTI